jgi:dTDP-4-amino-4,6-dideoxy-D-galactose acyltransferase
MNSCIVRPYTANNWEHIAPLLTTLPSKPLARHGGWRASALLDFSCERVRKVLGDENGGAWMVLQQDHVRGFARFSTLPLDSEQLGMRTARIDYLIAEGSYSEQRQIKETLLEQALFEIRDSGVWYLTMSVDANDLSSLHALEEAGFITVDGLLTFSLDVTTAPSIAPAIAPVRDFTIRFAAEADADRAATLARTAFLFDRLHSDPFISRELADDLRAVWMHNSCNSNTADAVLLAEDKTGLLGFVSCSLQPDTTLRLGRSVGQIALVAVAERARGRGVGYATMLAALEWFREQDCEIVEVGAQLRNIPAARLYQKCGFGLVGSSISLRRLL